MNSDKEKLWRRRIFLLIMDTISIAGAGFLALLIRFDFSIGQINKEYLERFLHYLPIQVAVVLVLFALFRMYNSLWEFASIDEMTNILLACICSVGMHLAGMQVIYRGIREQGMSVEPRSFWPMELVFLILMTGGIRFLYRVLRRMGNAAEKNAAHRIMIVGAGDAADTIIREVERGRYPGGKVVTAVDDDPKKLHAYIQGIRIDGSREDIPALAEKHSVTDIFIAIPSLPRKELKGLVEICNGTSCNIKILPGMQQLMTGEVSVSRMRNVQVEDLLGRDPVELDNSLTAEHLKGKVVLVTGGGGSIGSELCRQIAAFSPKQLIIIEIYENNAYDIQQELKVSHPELNLVVLIASIRNTNRMDRVFSEYHPDVVYHAAAHKHVPLMEDSPNEALKNNVYGTLKLCRMCDRYHVKRMVQISTDKAVNPTNVMGASKRMCEMVIQAYNTRSKTEFVAVRFGNVLGSNGSVIPLFKKQIAAGGPVTVTHPDIIRYFMTIPEAVSLVLKAGSMAKGGEIFVLDMGEPVKIDDMARNLIRLSGYVPDRDIEIVYTGLRPGEKLYEELLMDEEGLQDTAEAQIHIGRPIEFDEEGFLKRLDSVYEEVTAETLDVRAFIREWVSGYHTPEKE